MGQERLGPSYFFISVNIISARPCKQPLMVLTLLKVYMELGSSFLFLQEQIKDIIIKWRRPIKDISSHHHVTGHKRKISVHTDVPLSGESTLIFANTL